MYVRTCVTAEMCWWLTLCDCAIGLCYHAKFRTFSKSLPRIQMSFVHY